ncbi:MAG: hypothetical protein U9O20_00370 [Patescibacteria group bacterium]|nr:hypothetical protein [Patescibacteria group bacterium]
MPKKSQRKSKWVLSGKFCPKRKWDENDSKAFKIVFSAFSMGHARKIAMQRLKAFVRRNKLALGVSKFTLGWVILKNGSEQLVLRSNLQNNSILFAKKPYLVFIEESF